MDKETYRILVEKIKKEKPEAYKQLLNGTISVDDASKLAKLAKYIRRATTKEEK